MKGELINNLRNLADVLEQSEEEARFEWNTIIKYDKVQAPFNTKYGMKVLSGRPCARVRIGTITNIEIITMRPGDEIIDDRVKIIEEADK